jgi:hypothetical protein
MLYILVQETCCCTTCIEKGAAAFDMLQELIKEVHGISALAEQRGAVAKNLEVYYERYYRSLLLTCSQDVNRCMTHALSHPTDKDFQCLCTHEHGVECEIMQQDVAFLQELRADIVQRVTTLDDAEREHLLWKLNACEVLLSKYKAHLLRKTWDREAYKRLVGRLTATSALIIIDYGQKVEPMRHNESQSECFGKAGISQFGATYLMLAEGFTAEQHLEMLGEERVRSLKREDLIAFTTVFYNSDAHQVVACHMFGE